MWPLPSSPPCPLPPHAGTRYPLEKVKEAIAEATAPARGGKVLLEG